MERHNIDEIECLVIDGTDFYLRKIGKKPISRRKFKKKGIILNMRKNMGLYK